MIAAETTERILARFAFLEARMQEGLARDEMEAVGREYSDLRPVVERIGSYQALVTELAETEALCADPEMRALAEAELPELRDRLEAAEQGLRVALLPKDAADARPAILEIRPGTGGEEAALFAGDLLRMYQRHAESHGWRFEVLEEQTSDLGGIREVMVRIVGEGVFARLKYESGVHRVQRVPVTEGGGRIHTSAATVAVLPEAEAVDIHIDPADIRIDTMRASGAGGQHVNKTDSAVRLTHFPSGIVVTSSLKSQHQNRDIAMQVLRARLYQAERDRTDNERADSRRAQVGSGDRSERIRTYNFPQARITDHRINLTLYKLDAVMQGDLDEIIDALQEEAQARALAEAE